MATNMPSPAPQRRLAHSEKTFHLFSSERSRDKANAHRSINQLEQGDAQLYSLQYIAQALCDLNTAQNETNKLLWEINGALQRRAGEGS
ncbi:MAG: hypothetical protein ACRDMV_08660 [Streptosporangiales bacterium]